MEQTFFCFSINRNDTIFFTLDALGLKYFNKNKSIQLTHLIKHADKTCPNKELGRSFKTDRTQVVLQFIQVVPITLDAEQKGAKNTRRRQEEDERLRNLEIGE